MNATAAPLDAFAAPRPRARAVGRSLLRSWLLLTALLVLAMVTVGGATRLTGSGLSITEWRPVTGALPPLGEAAWEAEFERYRGIPQYELVNKGMSLSEFKAIYAWEWGHRQLGRLIGVVYLGGFLFLLARRLVDARTGLLLFGMGLLLGLQGFVGWIMVASGLQPGMTAVAPVKLTLHLTLASLFLASLVWMACRTAPLARAEGQSPAASHGWAPLGLLALVLVQIALGGLVAGSKAGFTFNTWPLMDGRLVPARDTLFAASAPLFNLAENPALVQFNHRLAAYLLLAAALWHALRLRGAAPASPAASRAVLLAGLILAQAGLGVATLLLAVPLWAGLAHQGLAMVVLIAAVAHAALSAPGPARTAAA